MTMLCTNPQLATFAPLRQDSQAYAQTRCASRAFFLWLHSLTHTPHLLKLSSQKLRSHAAKDKKRDILPILKKIAGRFRNHQKAGRMVTLVLYIYCIYINGYGISNEYTVIH